MALLPEAYEELLSFKKKRIDGLFARYDQELQALLKKRNALGETQRESAVAVTRMRYGLIRRLLIAVGGVIMMFVYVDLAGEFLINSRILDVTLRLVPYFGVGLIFVLMSTYLRREEGQAAEALKTGKDTSREMEQINREIDQYRSLLWTRARDLLVDAEVARIEGPIEADAPGVGRHRGKGPGDGAP